MDYRHELDFANEQLDLVKVAIGEYLKTNPYELIRQHDAKRGKYTVRAALRHDAPPRLRSLIGTTLNSLRQSLDYLATSLVERNGTPKHPGNIEFPIFVDRALYEGKTGAVRKIGEASASAQAAIDELQPYRGSDPTQHPLWLIHDLGRKHKHRKHLVTGAIAGVTNLILRQGAFIGLTAYGGVALGAFEHGALVAEWEVAPMPPVDMEFQVAFNVAFAKKGPARGATVIETLNSLRNHVRDVVFPKLQPFL